jgi:hypothetical protein
MMREKMDRPREEYSKTRKREKELEHQLKSLDKALRYRGQEG